MSLDKLRQQYCSQSIEVFKKDPSNDTELQEPNSVPAYIECYRATKYEKYDLTDESCDQMPSAQDVLDFISGHRQTIKETKENKMTHSEAELQEEFAKMTLEDTQMKETKQKDKLQAEQEEEQSFSQVQFTFKKPTQSDKVTIGGRQKKKGLNVGNTSKKEIDDLSDMLEQKMQLD